MNHLEWGLSLVRRGWYIFPAYQKKPLVKWSTQSTVDEEQVRQWAIAYPDCNWCIKTGAESDLVVVDWDGYKQSTSGLQQFPLEPYPWTYTTETAKGGTHFYFQHPGGKVSNSAGKLHQYVDVRGDGGMVVAYPPVYDTALAECPEHWLTINAAAPERAAPAATLEWDDEGDGTDVGVAALEEAYQTVLNATPGTRNPTLFQQAADVFKLVAGGELSEETATVAMDTAGRIAGLGADEVHATLQSARRRGFEEPFSPSKVLRIRNEDREALAPDDGTYADAEWGSTTDTANALRLADRFEYDLRFAPTHGWLRYQGGRLATVGGYPYDEGSNLSSLVRRDASQATTSEEMAALEKWATQSAAMTKIKAALDLAADFPGIRFDPRDLDVNPLVLNTPAGVYDLHDGSRSISSAKDLMTRITAVHPQPGAPVWEAFLRDVLPTQDMRSFLQRAIGYSITGLTREEVFFILYGQGQNGKSKLLEAVGRALGNYAHTFESKLIVSTNHQEHSTTTASLAGVRFAFTNEIDQGSKLDEGKVKSLTGGDAITARFMRRDEFTFQPTHKLWMATNHLPIITGTDRGMWRRVLVLPFSVNISDEKRDNLLSEKLAAEGAGILAWCIDGANAYLKYGLNPPVEVLTTTASYKASEDYINQFLNDTVVYHPQGQVKFADLNIEYQRWCVVNGVKPISAKALALELDRLGITKTRQGNGKAREGIVFQEGVRV